MGELAKLTSSPPKLLETKAGELGELVSEKIFSCRARELPNRGKEVFADEGVGLAGRGLILGESQDLN